MTRITLASDIARKPVVTFDGWDIAQIKDVIYAGEGGGISGFTLAGRGLFAGPLKRALPWRNVVGLGPAAVIVRSDDALVPAGEVFAAARSGSGAGRGNVLGAQVLTDDGSALGGVTDVVLRVPQDGSAPADVVGYAIAPPGTRSKGQPAQFIPLPHALATSGEHLMVPARVREYLTDDLAGFAERVEAYRRNEGGR